MKVYPLKRDAVAVYINSLFFQHIKNIKNIINKVNNLYNECFSSDFDTNVKNSVLILYVDMETVKNKKGYLKLPEKQALKLLNENVNNIQGFLRLELYRDHIEIYDVCTGKNHRRQGVMHALFENMLEVTPKQYKMFWLGVVFDNPDRDKAINFYLKNGFAFNNTTFTTPSNIRLRSPVLSFTHKRGELNTKTLNIYSALSDLECNFNFLFNWKDMILIQNNVYNLNAETGGTMNLIPEKNYVVLIPNLANIVYGDPNTLSVNTPQYYVSWHSHPDICYVKYNCYIGWPSSADMKNIYQEYLSGSLLHFVFTAEGLYAIKLSKEAMKFLYMIYYNSKWLESLGELINDRFYYAELHRGGDLFSDKERSDRITQFLQKANNFTLRDYIVNPNNPKETDFLMFLGNKDYSKINTDVMNAVKYFEKYALANFPLFEVKFYSSAYILANKRRSETIRMDSIRAPFNNFCPNF